MKKNTFSALCALALSFAPSSTASAALLFGFNSFNDSSSPEQASDGIFAATSTVTKTDTSSSTGGSNDGFYGSSASPSVGTNNGYLGFSDSGPLVFSVTNNSAIDYSLTAIYFDFTRLEPPSEPGGDLNSFFTVDIDAGSGPNFLDYGLLLNSQTVSSADADYTDGALLFSNYQPYVLSAGQTISFWFTGFFPSMMIDNVSLTGAPDLSGIPEVANFAALGGLLISGLTIRSRRRHSNKS